MPKFGLKTVGRCMNFFKYLYRDTYSNVFLLVQEDVSENFNESYHCKNLKFEIFGAFQLKMVSPGLN